MSSEEIFESVKPRDWLSVVLPIFVWMLASPLAEVEQELAETLGCVL